MKNLNLSQQEVEELLSCSFRQAMLYAPIEKAEETKDLITDPWLKKERDCAIMYLRGDMEGAVKMFTATDDPRQKLCCALTAITAAVSLGDFGAFHDISFFLNEYKKKYKDCGDKKVVLYIELIMAIISASAFLPEDAPIWMKKGQAELFPIEIRPFVMLALAKHKLESKEYIAALSICRTTTALLSREGYCTMLEVYMYIVSAIAYGACKKYEEADAVLDRAIKMCVPSGLVLPFLEHLTSLGGSVERRFNILYPNVYEEHKRKHGNVWRNWLTLHNFYAKQKLTTILSPREYHIAQQLCNGLSYTEISKITNLSKGRINNIVVGIYEKLGVHSKKELKDFLY